MPDIRLTLGGLELKNPVICASGEHVLTESGIRAGLAAGAAVVIAKSVNETLAAREQLARTDYALFDAHWSRAPWGTEQWAGSNLLCRSGLQPMATDDWIERIARLDQEAMQHNAWVAGSVILADLGQAVSIARSMEQAGLRLIEFNVGAPYGDEAASGAIVTERAAERIREQVAAVCEAVRIPVWVKLTGQSENVAGLAAAARDAGAASVVMIGRSLGMLPDLDTQAPALGTNLGYGGSWALPLACYWLARSRKRLGADYPLIGTNGARSGEDVLRMMLAGASAVELCTAVMTGGFDVIREAVAVIQRYADRKGQRPQDWIGLAADRLAGFGEQPARPDHWRSFVPDQTNA
jgi:dihydroorotate dehydrogenase (NAD+) catalytic subunit